MGNQPRLPVFGVKLLWIFNLAYASAAYRRRLCVDLMLEGRGQGNQSQISQQNEEVSPPISDTGRSERSLHLAKGVGKRHSANQLIIYALTSLRSECSSLKGRLDVRGIPVVLSYCLGSCRHDYTA